MTRMLAPSLAQRFPVRAPPLPLHRVENPQTPREWQAYVGTRVMLSAERGNRPVTARLDGIDDKGRATVLIPNHGHPITVPLSRMRRWLKGEHDDNARLAAQARNHPEHAANIPFPVPTPAQPEAAPMTNPSTQHGTESPAVALKEAQRSAAPGVIVIRDSISGKYWKGGKAGVPFEMRLHGFVTDIHGAAFITPSSAYATMNKARKRGGHGFRHELLTVEQASVHYGDRHAVLDRVPEKEHAAVVVKPDPAPELRMLPSAVPPLAITYATNPAPRSTSLETLRVSVDALEACVREKAAADSLAASQAVEMRKCEELVRVAKMRVDLGL